MHLTEEQIDHFREVSALHWKLPRKTQDATFRSRELFWNCLFWAACLLMCIMRRYSLFSMQTARGPSMPASWGPAFALLGRYWQACRIFMFELTPWDRMNDLRLECWGILRLGP